MLWKSCAGQDRGYLTNEEKKQIPKGVWEELEKKRIIGYATIPKEAFLPQYDLNLPARIERIGDSNECWAIPQDQHSGGRFRITKSEVERHAVFLEVLITNIVKEWKLEPSIKAAPPCGIRIGFKDHEIPIVILFEILEDLVIQAIKIQENLGVSKLIIMKMGRVDLSLTDKKRLEEQSIELWGTSEFLDLNCIPKWGLEFIRKTSDVIKVGPWVYNPNDDSVSFKTEQKELPPNRKKIIVKLIQNHGRIVTYNELLVVIYGKSDPYDRQHVQDTIYRLKEDLPKEAMAWIRNESGKGYILIQPSPKK